MAAVAQLKAVLGLDSAKYKAGTRDIRRENERMKQSFAQIGSAIGVSFSVAAVVGAARHIAEWSTEVSLAARRVGLMTSQMMALGEVAVRAGLKVENMQQIMSKMQQELLRAAEGQQSSLGAFGGIAEGYNRLTDFLGGALANRFGRGVKGLFGSSVSDIKAGLGSARAGSNQRDAAVEERRKQRAEERAQGQRRLQAIAQETRDEAAAETAAKAGKSAGRASERSSSRLGNVRGQGLGADALARVGGMVGNSRPQLAALDKQLKIQRELADVARETLNEAKETNSKLANMGRT